MRASARVGKALRKSNDRAPIRQISYRPLLGHFRDEQSQFRPSEGFQEIEGEYTIHCNVPLDS